MFDCGHFSAGARESASSLFCKRFAFLAVVMVSGALLSVRLSAEVTRVTFTKTGISVGSFGPSFSIVPGDFNNDGVLDLVTINASSLSFYEGLGDGKYAAPVTQTLSTGNPLSGPFFCCGFQWGRKARSGNRSRSDVLRSAQRGGNHLAGKWGRIIHARDQYHVRRQRFDYRVGGF
jgi:hypothetical protein